MDRFIEKSKTRAFVLIFLEGTLYKYIYKCTKYLFFLTMVPSWSKYSFSKRTSNNVARFLEFYDLSSCESVVSRIRFGKKYHEGFLNAVCYPLYCAKMYN